MMNHDEPSKPTIYLSDSMIIIANPSSKYIQVLNQISNSHLPQGPLNIFELPQRQIKKAKRPRAFSTTSVCRTGLAALSPCRILQALLNDTSTLCNGIWPFLWVDMTRWPILHDHPILGFFLSYSYWRKTSLGFCAGKRFRLWFRFFSSLFPRAVFFEEVCRFVHVPGLAVCCYCCKSLVSTYYKSLLQVFAKGPGYFLWFYPRPHVYIV